MPLDSHASPLHRSRWLALCFTVLIAATPGHAQPGVAETDVGIDHLILGVNDLEKGMAEFTRRTGVAPVKGGVHPGRGTQNALVSLGAGRYIEIMAPSHEPGTSIDAMTTSATLKPVGWALHTSDITRVVRTVTSAGFEMSPVRPGARTRPDGVKLSWQTASVSGASLNAAPFFIQWGTSTAHPSTQSPTGCALTSVEMSEPDPAPLTRFLASTGIAVSVSKGASAMRVVLQCPAGTIVF